MNDSTYISHHLVVAGSAWAATFTLIALAWALRLASPNLWQWSALLGFTGCSLSAVAAVLHVKAHLARVSNLIRNTSGPSGSRDLRAFR